MAVRRPVCRIAGRNAELPDGDTLPGQAIAGTAILDFGTSGAFDASVAVTGQASILATSVVIAGLAAAPTSDHSADEHLIEDIEVRASAPVAATGFTIRGRAGEFPLRGRWSVSWMWV